MQKRLSAQARAIHIWLMAPLLGFALFVGVFVSVAAPAVQAATTSSTLNFQARILNNLGGIVPDGNYNIDFKIYSADSTTGTVGTCSGSCVWEETRTNAGGHGVPVINGYFSVNLGSVTAFGSTINWDQQLWLTMNIGGVSTGSVTWDGEMQNSGHSIALTALPYAFTAGQLAKTSGANRGVLSFNTVANNPVITLPDETGTVCTTDATGVCAQADTGFVRLQSTTGTAQPGYFNINGTGILSTALQAPLVQTADSSSGSTTALLLRSGNETGSSLSSGSVTIKSGDASGGTNSSSGNIVIDSGSKSGSGTTGLITIGSTNASSITIGNTSQTGATTITGNNSNGGVSLGANTSVSGSNTFTTNSGLTTIGSGGITVNGGGSVAIQKGTDYSTTGASNSAAFTGSLIRLTGASTQTINGITGTSDGRIITLVNAAAQAAVIANQSGSAPTATERIITGTGTDISLAPDSSLELQYDTTTQRWRVISGVGGNDVTTIGTYSSSNHYTNGANITGNTLTLGSADATNPGLVDTSAQTFAGNKTFTGTLTVAPTTNVGSVVVKQTSAASPSNDIFDVQGTNGTSNFIQITSTAANQGAVTIQSFGANNLTLQAGSGTISLGTTTAINSSGALSLASGGSGGLTLQAASGTVSLGTSTTLNANGALTIASGGTSDLTLNSLSGTLKLGSNTTAVLFTNSGAASIDAASGQNLNLGTSNSAHTTTLGSTNASAATTIQGAAGITLSNNTSASANFDVSGSAALKSGGTNYSATGITNDVNFGNVSLVRLTGASAQTITGIAGGRDGYILTLFNAAGQAATLANQNTGSATLADRIITGSGADLAVPSDAAVTLVYDSTTQRWRVTGLNNAVSAVGTYSSSNHYSNGASITGNTLTLGSADSSNPGLVDTSAQTFAGNKTFTGTLSVAPTTNISSVVVKQTSASSPSNDIFDVQGTNGTSNFIQITSTAANQGAVTIQSFGSNNLTLQAGSGTISLGTTTAVGASGALSITSGGANNLTLQAGSGTVSLGTSTVLNANGALTLASGGTSDLTLNSLSGTLKLGSNTTALLFTNAGAASIDATSAQNLNLGTGASNHTTTLGSTNGTAATTVQSGSGGVSLSGNTTVTGTNSFTVNNGATSLTDSGGTALTVNNSTGANSIAVFQDNGTPVVTVGDSGATIFENSSNSANSFQVQNNSASDLFNVNTTDGYVISNGTADLGNELQNPGFEASGTTDGTGWFTPSATQVITNSSANAHSGNNELQITGNSTTHAVLTKYYAVHPGDTIYVEAWVKNSAGANGDGGIYVEYSDKDKGSATFTALDTGLPGTSYVLKSTTQTVAAGKYYVRIAASVKATATTGTFYFDDFYMKRVNQQAPLLIANTSATAFQVQNASAVTVLGVDATTGKIFSNIANGASAIGFTLNTTNTYSTAGAKLLSVQNNGAEEFSVDKDGNVNIPSTKFYEVGGSQIATTNLSDGSQIAMKNAANTFSAANSFQVTNTNAFQVQDAAGAHTYIQADTNGGTLYLGNTQTASTIQIGNSTGVAVSQTISIGSSNTTAASASTITIGSTIGGTTTLQSGGGIIITTLGTANNDNYLCRTTTTNIISTCNTTGTGVAFVNGGNTLGSLTGNLATIGTNDANSLQIKTNNVGRATFDQSNNLYLGNADGSGTSSAPNNFNVKGTGSAATGTAGGDLNLYGGAGNGTSTGSAGGNVTINGGSAGGSGVNNGGNITLVAGAATSTGTQGGVIVKNAANSTAAFQVQNAGGTTTVLSVNTSTPTITVAGGTVFASNTYTSGANSTITQTLVDNNTTISATATATNLTFTVPSPTTATTGRLLYIGNGGTNSFVLNIGSASFTLSPGSSATLLYIGSGWTDAGIDASTLQLGYTNSVGGTTPEIKLDGTRQTLNIQDADSTIGADILDVNASNAGGGGLGTVVFGVGNTGATKVHTTGTGSATAFVVQNANSANFITVDTTSAGNSVSLDSDTGSAGTIKIGNTGGHAQTVNIGLTATNGSNSTVSIATNPNASATNTISIGSNGNAANAVTIEAGGTGAVNIGNSDVAHTINIANGGSTTAQTVNIGSTSSTGIVNIKSGGQSINLTSNGSSAGTLVKSQTNSTAAFHVQNTSGFDLMNVDTSNNQITLGSTSQALVNSQGLKVYTGTGSAAVIDLLTPTDSATNSLYYGANAGRALFGYDGTNANAAVRGIAGRGFEVQTNNSSNNALAINTNGDTLLKNYASSTSAFQVQDNGANSYILVNTTAPSVTIANGNANVSVSVLCGAGGTCSFGNNATDHATNIGSTTGASLTTISGGSSGILVKPGTNSTSAFSVQPAGTTTPVFDVDTSSNRVGINTATPGASLTINSGVSNTSGLQFQQLTNTSPVSSSFSQLLGLDSSGNVGLSSAGISLTSPALAYWDGNNAPTGSNLYPTPISITGAGTGTDSSHCTTGSWAPTFVSGSGEELTAACGSQSGSINWNFSQVSFEETQFQFKAGGGNGADSTWFYSYANGIPTSEFGCTSAATSPCTSTLSTGYLIYFSEFHHCVGVVWGNYADGNQCNNGGGTSNAGTSPLASARIWNIGDGNFHDVDIQLRWNQIIVKWDGNAVLSVNDSYGRDLSNLGFGFGSRTGGSNNEHYIKGLLVTKLGTDTSRYNVAGVSPLGGNLYMDNANQRLGIGTATPDSTLEVDGTESHKTVVTQAGTVYQGSGNVTACQSHTGTSGFTASTTVTGSGTSFQSYMVGDQIVLPDGAIDTIQSVGSTTSLTVSTSREECVGSYTILAPAFSVTGTSSPTVQIGSSTTNATASLLTLDSYNSATDPTGTNGAMYYNTADNAFRCYQNSAWTNCTGIWQTVMTTSDVGVSADTTVNNDATLHFAMAANTSYSIRCQVYWFTTSTGGFKEAYTGPGSPTSVTLAHTILANTAWGALGTNTSGTAGTTTGVTTTGTNSGGTATYTGSWVNAATAGTWTYQWAQNSSAGTTTLRQGSYCDYAAF